MSVTLSNHRDPLQRVAALRDKAIDHVIERLYEAHGSTYERFGEAGKRACREDIGFHFDFLEPAMEFGEAAPLADYLCWLAAVLEARSIPADHVSASMSLLGEFLARQLAADDATLLRSIVEVAIDRFNRRPPNAVEHYHYQGEAWPECNALKNALVDGDHKQVRDMVGTAIRGALEKGGGVTDVAVHLVQPALYNIGLGWQQNRISVAQEHLATAGARTALAQGFILQDPQPPTGKRILLACLEGNQHALGLRMASDAFELAGWDAQFLGANTPTASVLRQIRDRSPHIVGFSATIPAHLRPVKAAIRAMHDTLGPSCPPVMVGGLAINQIEGVAKALGADFTCRDAKGVVGTAESWLQYHAKD
jgi:methanogenic corrinoid protein MtbC1